MISISRKPKKGKLRFMKSGTKAKIMRQQGTNLAKQRWCKLKYMHLSWEAQTRLLSANQNETKEYLATTPTTICFEKLLFNLAVKSIALCCKASASIMVTGKWLESWTKTRPPASCWQKFPCMILKLDEVSPVMSYLVTWQQWVSWDWVYQPQPQFPELSHHIA